MDVIEFEPGSIKDRIACSVHAIGENATRAFLNKCVDGNGHLINVAIDGMVRDGHLVLTERGHYVLGEALKPSYSFIRQFQNDMNQSRAAGSTRQPTNTAEAQMETKKCIGTFSCGQMKPLSEFYAGCSNCKRCVLDRQKQLKDGKSNQGSTRKAKTTVPVTAPAKTIATAAKATTKAAPVVHELVIPASGELHCSVIDHDSGCVDIQQGNDTIRCDATQLRALCDWATKLLSSIGA